MDIKEIRIKSEAELRQLLLELRSQLDDLRFKAAQKQLKNIRSIREVKKDIVRTIATLKAKEASAVKKTEETK